MLEQERIRKKHALENERNRLHDDLAGINPKLAIYKELGDRKRRIEKEISDLEHGQSLSNKI